MHTSLHGISCSLAARGSRNPGINVCWAAKIKQLAGVPWFTGTALYGNAFEYLPFEQKTGNLNEAPLDCQSLNLYLPVSLE